MVLRLLYSFFILLLVSDSFWANNDGIRFIENKGQWVEPILYKADLGTGALFLEQKCFTYNLYNSQEVHQNHFSANQNPTLTRYHAFKVNFVNALNADISASEKYPEYYNYILGNDQKFWKSNIKASKVINYQNIYSNINLEIYSVGNLLKYDVIINPKGNINDVQLNYEGVDNLQITKSGNLIIKTSVGEIVEQKPFAYQNINNKKVEVPCTFVLKNNTISFQIKGKYHSNIPLIIDPILIFASYSGSTADNFGMTATYGYDGSLFAGGTAFGVGYPTTLGAYDPSFNGFPGGGITDVVISRYDSSGTNLIYSTYIGGTSTETVHSLIANENNELYLYGATSSLDFPTDTNSYDNTFNGGTPVYYVSNGSNFTNGSDIYVAKLNPSGTTLLGSTYLGGSLNDGVNSTLSLDYDTLMYNYGDQYRGEIMLDKFGNCYITSSSQSPNFPIQNGFDDTLSGAQDAVIIKLNSNLTDVFWSTFLGGDNMDAGYSIKVDTSGYVYVCGGTASNNFPTTAGTINTTFIGGKTDGFITKIDTNGTQIISSTLLGTTNYDQCYFIEIDRFGSVYTVGQTRGSFPIINASYKNINSSNFVVRLNNSLTTIDYSTVFGNGNINAKFSPSAFLVDKCENVYVSGWGGDILTGVSLNGMPTTPGSFQPNTANGFDFYLIVLERNVQSLLYGTYFGGNLSQEHVDGGTSRFDKNGIVYQSVCAGCQTQSSPVPHSDFPTTPGAWSNTNNSYNCNNGTFKFDFEIVPKAQFTVDNYLGCAPLTVTFTNNSGSSDTYLWDFGSNDTTSQIFNPVRTYNTPGTYNVTLMIKDSICNTIDTAHQVIVVNPPITITVLSDDTTSCYPVKLSVNAIGATTYIWSSNILFTDTLNSGLTDTTTVFNNQPTTYYVMATNGVCFDIDSVIITFVSVEIETIGGAICSGQVSNISVNSLNSQVLSYSWQPLSEIVSGANTANPLVNPSSTTTFYVTAQNTIGCTTSDSAIMVVSGFNPNILSITSDKDTLFNGEGTYLHAHPDSNFTYLWSPSNHLTNSTDANPYANPTSTTNYTVFFTETSSGCKYQKSYTIYAWEILCGEPDVFLPNAFTPNGDKENDLLFLRGRNVESMHLKIYNRWGELVFETNKKNVGWDGTYKGKPVDPAVFVYHLSVVCVDGQEYFKKGNVTVIR